MYKKIILSLMFLPIFSSNETLCVDPTADVVITIVSNIITFVAHKTIDSYNQKPDQAARDAEANEYSHFIDARKKFRKCVVNSKPGSTKLANGIPTECNDLARAFSVCGGIEEIIKIITDLELLDK